MAKHMSKSKNPATQKKDKRSDNISELERQSEFTGNKKDVKDVAAHPSFDLFINADTVIMEYYDLLESRWFFMITLMSRVGTMDNFFDTSIFADMTDEDLYEWYVGRRHYNPFEDIPCKVKFKSAMDKLKFYNTVAYDNMAIKELFGYECKLNIADVLNRVFLTSPKMVKHFYVYGGMAKNEFLEAAVTEMLPNSENIHFIYGEFADAIKDLNKDATYILADASKVETLIKTDRINMSSILIADGWRYNYTENEGKLIIDPKELEKSYVCRVAYFNDLFMN